MTPKHTVITSFLSQTKDRFHTYNETKSLEERFSMVVDIEGISAVEVVHPYEVGDSRELTKLLERYGLGVSAVNVNVKAEPEFRDGGLTSKDRLVRERAVQFIRDARDYAASIQADKVTCCPLSDGYEFAFGCDYGEVWQRLVESFGQAAAHLPEIPLFIEYKPSETRARCFLDTAAKTLCLLNEIANTNTGVTLDFGHSLYGRENPAEALALLEASPYSYYIHINDNDARWDWDFMVGTKHFIDYAEFLFYLQEYGYSDYLTSDTSPTRWDIRGTFEANARLTNRLWARLESLDRKQFKTLISQGDYLETWRFIEKNIFVLGD